MCSKNDSPFEIGSHSDLFNEFEKFCKEFLTPLFLNVQVSRQRICDVFETWQEDLDRNSNRNFREVRGQSDAIRPDHIKSAAYLTYWLRRNSPIVNLSTPRGSYGMYSLESQLEEELGIDFIELLETVGEDSVELTQDELMNIKFLSGLSMGDIIDYRAVILASGNEFLSFMFGFMLARAYEIQKGIEKGEGIKIGIPTLHFTRELCYIFKFKSISPHAVYLIFRSLLQGCLVE